MFPRPTILFRFCVALLPALACCSLARAQASPAASRVADLQLGITGSYARPDYGPDNFKGYGFYGDLDVRHHLGLEFDFHQLSGPRPVLYERSYEVGPRYTHPIKDRILPYVKAMYGRGVFNFVGNGGPGDPLNQETANLAYNMVSYGGGLDLRVKPYLNLRAFDFEYQTWYGFPPHGLTPMVVSFGAAYHFNGGTGDSLRHR